MLGSGVAVGLACVAAARGTWSPCGLSMVSAINPFSERARGHRYWVTACWFVAGAAVGGAGLGVLGAALAAVVVGAGLAGPGGPAAVLAALCCLAAAASDLRLGGFALPDHPRQVNERWLERYRRWVYAAGFGLQIGCGLATYIMTAAVYLVVVLGALTGSPAAALALGLLFGTVRGLAVLLTARCHDPERLRRLHRRLQAAAPWSVRAVVAVELAGAVLAVGGAGAELAVPVVALAAAVAAPAAARAVRTRVRLP